MRRVCLLLVDILDIQSNLGCAAISAITVSFPAISVAMLFLFTVQMYAVALFLTTAGVYFAKGKGPLSTSLSIICITLGLGGYQAYFTYAVALMLLVLIISLMDENKDWKQVFLEGIKCLFILIASIILYAIIQKIFQTVLDKEMVEYQNADKMWQMDLSTVPAIIKVIYRNIFHLSNSLYMTLNNTFVIRKGILLLQIASVICIATIIIRLIKKKQYQKAILMIIIAVLYPIACDLMELMAAQAYWKYSIMWLGIIGVFYLPAVLADRLLENSRREKFESNNNENAISQQNSLIKITSQNIIPILMRCG